MANDNWEEEGSTLEFINSKWEKQSSNFLWSWIICPRCNKQTDHSIEEFSIINPLNFACPHCGKLITIDRNIKKDKI